MKQSIYTCLLFVAMFVVSCTPSVEYKTNHGFVFGTTYTLIYKHDKDLQKAVMDRLRLYDASLSPYNQNSIISKVNRNEDVEVDTFFMKVFNKAEEIYRLSGGVFDITLRPLSRLWKFDSQRHDTITVAQYESLIAVAKDSLSVFVGMDKVRLDGRKIVKADERVQLNANALAEGCGIDLAAEVLEEHGVTDYMVEIGGELRLKGRNPRGERWRIGVDSPEEGNILEERKLQRILNLTNCAVSSSGGYRQYIWRADGKRLSHIIDPRTGAPVETEIESMTVIGPNTMTTDALATTFTVLGVEGTREMLRVMEGIRAYVIYRDKDGTLQELELGDRAVGEGENDGRE